MQINQDIKYNCVLEFHSEYSFVSKIIFFYCNIYCTFYVDFASFLRFLAVFRCHLSLRS